MTKTKQKNERVKKENLWYALEQACNLLNYNGGYEKTVEELRKVLIDNR